MSGDKELADFQTLCAAWAKYLGPLHERTTSFEAWPEQTLELVQSFDTESEKHYCPGCRSRERMRVSVTATQAQALKSHWRLRIDVIGENERLKRQASADLNHASDPSKVPQKPVPPNLLPLPSCYTFTCLRCNQGKITALAYEGPSGPEVLAFPAIRGAGTPSTPDSVAYYVDQAQRAVSVGARSAAATMYRSAIEMMLFQAGFQNGMLRQKIEQLKLDHQAGKAPPWAKEAIDYFEILKDLGNGAIHPNDGDVSRQEAIDRASVETVESVLGELLWLVYDQPARDAARKAALQSTADRLKK